MQYIQTTVDIVCFTTTALIASLVVGTVYWSTIIYTPTLVRQLGFLLSLHLFSSLGPYHRVIDAFLITFSHALWAYFYYEILFTLSFLQTFIAYLLSWGACQHLYGNMKVLYKCAHVVADLRGVELCDL